MTVQWDEITSNPNYQGLPLEDKQKVRDTFYNEVITKDPAYPTDLTAQEKLKQRFFANTITPEEEKLRDTNITAEHAPILKADYKTPEGKLVPYTTSKEPSTYESTINGLTDVAGQIEGALEAPGDLVEKSISNYKDIVTGAPYSGAITNPPSTLNKPGQPSIVEKPPRTPQEEELRAYQKSLGITDEEIDSADLSNMNLLTRTLYNTQAGIAQTGINVAYNITRLGRMLFAEHAAQAKGLASGKPFGEVYNDVEKAALRASEQIPDVGPQLPIAPGVVPNIGYNAGRLGAQIVIAGAMPEVAGAGTSLSQALQFGQEAFLETGSPKSAALNAITVLGMNKAARLGLDIIPEGASTFSKIAVPLGAMTTVPVGMGMLREENLGEQAQNAYLPLALITPYASALTLSKGFSALNDISLKYGIRSLATGELAQMHRMVAFADEFTQENIRNKIADKDVTSETLSEANQAKALSTVAVEKAGKARSVEEMQTAASDGIKAMQLAHRGESIEQVEAQLQQAVSNVGYRYNFIHSEEQPTLDIRTDEGRKEALTYPGYDDDSINNAIAKGNYIIPKPASFDNAPVLGKDGVPTYNITLYKGGDPSYLYHEHGHFILEIAKNYENIMHLLGAQDYNGMDENGKQKFQEHFADRVREELRRGGYDILSYLPTDLIKDIVERQPVTEGPEKEGSIQYALQRSEFSKGIQDEIDRRKDVFGEPSEENDFETLSDTQALRDYEDILEHRASDKDNPLDKEERQHLNEIRDKLISLGVYKEVTPEELKNTITLGGKKYDFKKNGKFYSFSSWKPLEESKSLESKQYSVIHLDNPEEAAKSNWKGEFIGYHAFKDKFPEVINEPNKTYLFGGFHVGDKKAAEVRTADILFRQRLNKESEEQGETRRDVGYFQDDVADILRTKSADINLYPNNSVLRHNYIVDYFENAPEGTFSGEEKKLYSQYLTLRQQYLRDEELLGLEKRKISKVSFNITSPYLKNDGTPLDESILQDKKILELLETSDSFRQKLINKGYTAVPYINRVEHSGSISIMLLKPMEAKDNGDLKQLSILSDAQMKERNMKFAIQSINEVMANTNSTWKERAKVFEDYIRTYSGEIFPGVGRHGTRAQNALVHLIYAPQYGEELVNDYIRQVIPGNYSYFTFQPNRKFMNEFGAILAQDQLEGLMDKWQNIAKKAYNKGDIKSGDDAIVRAMAIKNLWELSPDVLEKLGMEEFPFKNHDEFMAMLNRPDIQQAINKHKQLVQPELFRIFKDANSKEIQPWERGRYTGAFINMIHLEPTDNPNNFGVSVLRDGDFNSLKKKTQFSREFTGQSEMYDFRYDAMIAKGIGKQIVNANKNLAIKALVDDGLAVIKKNSELVTGKPVLIDGDKTQSFPLRFGLVDEDENFATSTSKLYVKMSVAHDVEQAFNMLQSRLPDRLATAIFKRSSGILNQYTLQSVGEVTAHTVNLLSTVLGDILTKPGGVKGLVDSVHLYISNNKEFNSQMTKLSSIGVGKAKWDVSTENFKDVPIAKQIEHWAFSPVTYSGRYVQMMSEIIRLAGDKTFDELVKRDIAVNTEENRRRFDNQIGQYSKAGQNRLIQLAREYQFGPFSTASTKFFTNSLRHLALAPGLQVQGGVRSGNYANLMARKFLVLGGLIGGTVGAYNTIRWGTPFGSTSTPWGSVRLSDGPNGEERHYDLFARITGVPKALRTTGLQDALQSSQEGTGFWNGLFGQKANANRINTLVAPFAGPIVNVASRLASGRDLYGNINYAMGTSTPKERKTYKGESEGWNNLITATGINSTLGVLGLAKADATPSEVINKILGPFGVKSVYGKTIAERVSRAMVIKTMGDNSSLTTRQEAEHRAELRDLMTAIHQYKDNGGESIEPMIEEAKRKGIIESDREARDVRIGWKDDILMRNLKNSDINFSNALDIWKVMTPEEKKREDINREMRLKLIAEKKRKNSSQQLELTRQAKDAGIRGL